MVGLRGRVLLRGRMHRVADTKGSLKREGFCYGHIISCRGYQGWFGG